MRDQPTHPAAQAGATIRHAETLLAQLPHHYSDDGPDLTGAALAAGAALAELANAGLPAPLPDPGLPIYGSQPEARRLLHAAATLLRRVPTTSPNQALAVGAAINHLDYAAQLLES